MNAVQLPQFIATDERCLKFARYLYLLTCLHIIGAPELIIRKQQVIVSCISKLLGLNAGFGRDHLLKLIDLGAPLFEAVFS